MEYLLNASFSVEADSAQEAEGKFEDWLAEVTDLERYDTPSVAFDCIREVSATNDGSDDDDDTEPQAQLNTALFHPEGWKSDGQLGA